MASTFTIDCPCGCGETVSATDEGFAATTVEVASCAKRRAWGIVSMTFRKSTFAQPTSVAYRVTADGITSMVYLELQP